MNPQGFNYPPPPPPPPVAAASAFQPTHQSNPRGGRGGRGGRGARGARGSGPRGGTRGAYNSSSFNTHAHNGSDQYPGGASYYSNQQPPMMGADTQHHGFPSQQQQPQPFQQYQPAFYHNNAGFPQSQQPIQNIPSYHQHSTPFTQNALPQSWNQAPVISSNQHRGGFHQGNPRIQHNNAAGNKRKRDQFSHGDSPNASNNISHTPYTNHNYQGQRSLAKVKPAPAVPSFGTSLNIPSKLDLSLPSKPPGTIANKNRKKKPKLFSAEDDLDEAPSEDEDEEAKLTSKGTISHDGQEFKVNTPEGIAKWIAARRARFPTKARIEAKRLAQAVEEAARKETRDASKLAAQKALKAQVKASITPSTGKSAEDKRAKAKKLIEEADKLQRKAERSRKKADKLREAAKSQKKADKRQKRKLELGSPLSSAGDSQPATSGAIMDLTSSDIAEEPADESTVLIKSDDSEGTMVGNENSEAKLVSELDEPNPSFGPLMAEALMDSEDLPAYEKPDSEKALSSSSSESSSDSASDSDSDISHVSGDSSSSGSDSYSDGSAPEIKTSKLNGPVRVPPPARVAPDSLNKNDKKGPTTDGAARRDAVSKFKNQGFCNKFLQAGFCKNRACKYKHEYPDEFPPNLVAAKKESTNNVGGEKKSDTATQKDTSRKRKTLLEVLRQREQDAEDSLVWNAMEKLGKSGFFG
ncbi:hypothetical protein K402DRAFT_458040 [Aulographum hederae CBS 113979]|uniref:C3H1-type domain-containing protein n=1 Tax=Aulographum hederae CBS 113979 TaxID=1176131 RepID=A0A6G1GKR0_9PEZI|nr:hypothetical protein K402DRAFT_458040 [Aulographum hederae CBS 113979]